MNYLSINLAYDVNAMIIMLTCFMSLRHLLLALVISLRDTCALSRHVNELFCLVELNRYVIKVEG